MSSKRTKASRRKPLATDWVPDFLAGLSAGRTVAAAAGRAKVGVRTTYDRRLNDPQFAAAWEAACEVGIQTLEEEARRRAVEGVLRPVFHAGEKVGSVREYSDTLLIFLLKAKRPAVYRDTRHVTLAGDPAAPLAHTHVDARTLTDAELDRRIAAIEAGAGATGPGAAGGGAGQPESGGGPAAGGGGRPD